MKGKAPQIPALVKPKKKSEKNSFLTNFKFAKISLCVNKKRIKKAINQRQKAKEIGGIDSTDPLAMIRLLAIKIG